MTDTTKQAGSSLVGQGTPSFPLQSRVIKTASFDQTDLVQLTEQFNALVIILNVFSADRADANETYDFYIWTKEAPASWDIVHFVQIATIGAKTFVAKVHLATRAQTVIGTTLAEEASLTVAAGAANAIKSLTVNGVRHGPIGRLLGYSVVIVGTTPSIDYEILVRGE